MVRGQMIFVFFVLVLVLPVGASHCADQPEEWQFLMGSSFELRFHVMKGLIQYSETRLLSVKSRTKC